MASFPTSKVHRVSRRQLGRGQSPARPGATVSVVASTNEAVLTFSVPVVAQGPVGLVVEGDLVPVSQEQTSPTVVRVDFGTALAGLDWSFPGSSPVRTMQGGGVAAATGTF